VAKVKKGTEMNAIYLPREIRNFRNSLGLSQERFGKRYNRTYQTVSAWELGNNQAPLEVFIDVFNWLTGGKVVIDNERRN
jgi:transcriptional regulator with XRE-family HTH domain